MQQVQDSYSTVDEDEWMADFEELPELEPMDGDVSEDVYRSSVSRKELRTKAVRDREGVIGKGNSKRRKY
ncbi:MAG: hypothetical protein ACRDCE_00050 [Cetobacterium sp.]|uniref:hypothetical protein n=1 Tax=Cetobacterium sp. TaxID=2071632 RepID=UPI003EE7262B